MITVLDKLSRWFDKLFGHPRTIHLGPYKISETNPCFFSGKIMVGSVLSWSKSSLFHLFQLMLIHAS